MTCGPDIICTSRVPVSTSFLSVQGRQDLNYEDTYSVNREDPRLNTMPLLSRPPHTPRRPPPATTDQFPCPLTVPSSTNSVLDLVFFLDLPFGRSSSFPARLRGSSSLGPLLPPLPRSFSSPQPDPSETPVPVFGRNKVYSSHDNVLKPVPSCH